ncbi:PEP-CTERM sorting domain-containing protein [Moorena producens JHB]|uniref:PEP-CTERM sorting domain-containing protein n=1 Tax=Moorena producens (strain JHB) TaxID=1454205 RepID=A0A1D9FUS7_MOOP1|nr:PEP-CTERM sorting domain-containing protein [Moorena producens]AOY79024.1 PEP-CTERM sorting domain-containing protein [Moorena producens JHB]
MNFKLVTKRFFRSAILTTVGTLAVLFPTAQKSEAFVIWRNSEGLSGGSRWDAAPRTINGLERSLDGGLRYSLQGGSYQAFRDLFTWDIVPVLDDFQAGIEQAFNAWTVVDPGTGLGTDLFFTADLETPVVGFNEGQGGVDFRGAEIDLFGSNNAFFWDVGDNRRFGETNFNDIDETVTLTSGTVNYAGSRAISGADIIFNSNPGAVYTLDVFRRLLTHEIGHTLGLGDVEDNINPGAFIDDNYDGTTSAMARATLTNPIAQLVDVRNPANSPFSLFTVPNGDPGVDTRGVDILMESQGLGIAPGNPVTNLKPLTNDDYGGRQFLYPFVSVPEPTSILGLLTLGTLGAGSAVKKKL